MLTYFLVKGWWKQDSSYVKNFVNRVLNKDKSYFSRKLYSKKLRAWTTAVVIQPAFKDKITKPHSRRVYYIGQSSLGVIAETWQQCLGDVLNIPWVFSQAELNDPALSSTNLTRLEVLSLAGLGVKVWALPVLQRWENWRSFWEYVCESDGVLWWDLCIIL